MMYTQQPRNSTSTNLGMCMYTVNYYHMTVWKFQKQSLIYGNTNTDGRIQIPDKDLILAHNMKSNTLHVAVVACPLASYGVLISPK